MEEAGKADKGDTGTDGYPQLCRPSWVDRFGDWVDRLPGQSWLFYLALGVALLLVQATALWVEGAYPVGTFLPIHLGSAAGIAYLLALIPWLDNTAAMALSDLRPVLKTSEEEYNQLRHQLTTLSSRPTLLASLVIEQNTLSRIPTWPWKPETVRLLIAALLFPLGVWIAQLVLQAILAP